MMGKNVIDENYNWPLLKYDYQEKKVVGEWSQPLTVSQEPRFITNPENKSEEDGFLLSICYNCETETTSLFAIDPATMTTL